MKTIFLVAVIAFQQCVVTDRNTYNPDLYPYEWETDRVIYTHVTIEGFGKTRLQTDVVYNEEYIRINGYDYAGHWASTLTFVIDGTDNLAWIQVGQNSMITCFNRQPTMYSK